MKENPLRKLIASLTGTGADHTGDATSKSCQAYYAGMINPPVAAANWCKAGDYFSWESTLPTNKSYGQLDIFYTCTGSPQDPALLLIHGYPTSSYDFARLAEQLSSDHYVCTLDTPGYGFSDKPTRGYKCSILDDARLVDDFIRRIVGLKRFTLITHDKGSSVGLALLQIYQSYATRPYTIDHHIITNGNIYLPLAQLSMGQKLLLHPILGPIGSSLITGWQMARGLASRTYTPALSEAEVEALASILDYQNGMTIQHELIQYLNERRANEVSWLETLGRSDVPTTLIWGEQDQIAPTAVSDYVWANYLKDRSAPAHYWRIPCANHYLQFDQPELLAALIRSAIDPASSVPEVADASCQPVMIGQNI